MRWLALLFLLCGCRSAPLEFPVGLYGVESPAAIPALKDFNAFQSYTKSPDDLRALAAAARESGALFMASPQRLMDGAPLRGVVWYLEDEPDVHGTTAAQLQALDKTVRAWAPGALTSFVVGDGRRAKDYPGAADVLMVDWYPVPHLPLESAGDHVRFAAAAAEGRRVWAVLQAMDWRDYPQRDARRPRQGRFPDAAELRFMSYDAVLGGASGVWFYTYTRPSGATLSDSPLLLSAVAGAARELRAMAPVFAHGRPMELPFPAPADGWAARAWRHRGRDYLVLVNRTKDRMWKVPQAALEPRWRPLFEVRRDPRELLHAARGAHYLKPYQVLVLESRLRWR